MKMILQYLKNNIVISALLFAILSFFCFRVVTEIYFTLPSFDGAMNLQVPRNLIESGKYSMSYNGGAPFDHRIQIGSPLLFPIAFIFWVFGISSFTAQIPSAIYLILLAALIFAFVKGLCGKWAGFLMLIIFIQTPHLLNFGLHVYGEIPALFFILLGLFLFYLLEFNKTKVPLIISFLIGVCIGLAYLTKTVALIVLPSLFFFILVDILLIKRLPKKAYGLMLLGFLFPILFFEFYKLSSIGLQDYRFWWPRELSAVFKQAGVAKGYSDTPKLFSKIGTHFSIFSDVFKLPKLMALIFLFAPFLMIVVKYGKEFLNKQFDNISLSFSILSGTSLTYMLWWMAITPTQKAWARRIIDGFILQEIISVVILGVVIIYSIGKFKGASNLKERISSGDIVLGILSIFLGITLSIMFVNNFSGLKIVKGDVPKKIAAEKVAATISGLPSEAKIYGSGWWQAPVLSFLSGRNFYDIKNVNLNSFNSADQNYFVVDEEAFIIAKKEIDGILNKIDNEIIDIAGNYYLYKIKEVRRFLPKKETSAKEDLRSFVDFTKHDYKYVTGLHQYEKNFRWSDISSSFLLKYDNPKYLYIKISVPDIKGYQSENVQFSVYLDDMLLKTYDILNSGILEITIDVARKIKDRQKVTVELSINKRWYPPKSSLDKRRLAFVVEKLGFIEGKK